MLKKLIIIILAINFNNCFAQTWINLPASRVQKLSAADSSEKQKRSYFRLDSNTIVVENVLTIDFAKLFLDDTTAFQTIYNGSAKIMAAFPCDSLEILKIGLSEFNHIVYFQSGKITKNKNSTETWVMLNPYKDGRRCDTWFNIKKKRVGKTIKIFVSKVDKLCEL